MSKGVRAERVGPTESIRRSLETSNDPRVARTRRAIADAVHELSAAGDDITVASIVRTAGISRAGFYSHYSGLDDLAVALMSEVYASITEIWFEERESGIDAMLASQHRLVAHFADNRWFYRSIASMPISKDGYLAAVRALAATIELPLAPFAQAEPVPATARYIAGAAYGLIDAWLTGEVDLTQAQLVERLVALLPPWFSGRNENVGASELAPPSKERRNS